MKKLVCIMIVAMIFIATLGFTPNNTSNEKSYDYMLGCNPQRTSHINPNTDFKPRMAKRIIQKNINEIGDPTSLLCVSNNLLILNGWNSGLYCYDIQNKQILWSKKNPIYRRDGIICVDNKLYYVYSNKVYCCNLIDGGMIWESEFDKTISNVRASHPTINMSENSIFIALYEKVICFQKSNGDVLWEQDLPNPYTFKIANFSSQSCTAYANGKLFFYQNGLYCINANDGSIIWEQHPTYKKPSNNETYGLVCYSDIGVLLSNNTVITERGVTFHIDTGDIIWNTTEEEISLWYMHSKMGLADRYLFQGDEHSIVVFVCDATTGNLIWELGLRKKGIGYSFNLISTDTFLFVIPEEKGTLLILNISDGKILNAIEGEYSYNSLFSNNTIYSLDKENNLFCLSPAADFLTFQINSNTYKPDNDEMTEMDSEPTILQDRTYLPARYATEPLGGQVFWDASERKVTCKLVAPDNAETEDYKENIVELWIGKSTAKLNGVEVQIDPDNPDVVPTIINDRTMVPMRFLAESLGCEVEWIAETKEIILTYTP